MGGGCDVVQIVIVVWMLVAWVKERVIWGVLCWLDIWAGGLSRGAWWSTQAHWWRRQSVYSRAVFFLAHAGPLCSFLIHF